MARLAIDGLSGFGVDEREIARGGVSYSIDTVASFRDEHPDDELFFLIGADSVDELPRWRRIEDLARLVTFLVAGRPGVGEIPAGVGTVAGLRLRIMEGTRVGISSTDIRRRARAGLPLRGFVPDAVARVIAEEDLYR